VPSFSGGITCTPRSTGRSRRDRFIDIHTGPLTLRPEIKKDLGEFPFPSFWGPAAGIDSSRWIAAAARWIEEKHQPTLNLVYLPHLDYNLQRLGPRDPRVADDLRQIDDVAGDLIDFFRARDVQVAVLSEYGITEVDTPVHLNRVLRRNGWLSIKDELGLETLDCGGSRAFAIADHQVAHIYLNDPAVESQVRAAIEAEPGVERVLDAAEQTKLGLRHARAGDLIAIAKPHSWFTYYYWLDDAVAPDFARTIDIHRKAGYDPTELFVDPKLRWPKLRIAAFLLRKKLGLRGLLNVIPLDATLVRGSHGRIPENENYWPVLLLEKNAAPLAPGPITPSNVHTTLLRLVDPTT
jgi:predicted AlkP superfamily pyrophosphatase or phosphodiesterase